MEKYMSWWPSFVQAHLSHAPNNCVCWCAHPTGKWLFSSHTSAYFLFHHERTDHTLPVTPEPRQGAAASFCVVQKFPSAFYLFAPTFSHARTHVHRVKLVLSEDRCLRTDPLSLKPCSCINWCPRLFACSFSCCVAASHSHQGSDGWLKLPGNECPPDRCRLEKPRRTYHVLHAHRTR